MDNFYTFKFNHSKAMTAPHSKANGRNWTTTTPEESYPTIITADYISSVRPPTPLDKHWYQIETARKVLSLGGRALLADEVGLGKTAGLILGEMKPGHGPINFDS